MGRPTKASLAKGAATARIEGIPLWVKQALTRMVLEDKTAEQIAKSIGRTAARINAYAISPAGQDWIIGVKAAANDPAEFTRRHIASLVLNMATDNLHALEMAKKAGDHNAVRQMTQWWLERPEMLGAISKEQTPNITINITGGASLEPKMIESSHAEIEVDGISVEGSWEVSRGE